MHRVGMMVCMSSASVNFFLTGVNDSKTLNFGSHALLGGSQKYQTSQLAESSRRISNSIMHCGSCNVQVASK